MQKKSPLPLWEEIPQLSGLISSLVITQKEVAPPNVGQCEGRLLMVA